MAALIRFATPRRLLWFAWAAGFAVCLFMWWAKLHEQAEGRTRPLINGWDDNHYFAYVHSLCFDGDLDLRNEFEFNTRFYVNGHVAQRFGKALDPATFSPAGRPPCRYPIGTALLAQPFAFAARGAAAVWESATAQRVSSYSPAFMFAFAASGIAAGFAGIALAAAMLRRFYTRRTAIAAVIAGTAGLSIGYYIWIQPTMSHAAAFLTLTAFSGASLRWARETVMGNRATALRWAAIAGATFGVTCMVRTNLLMAGPVPLILLWAVARDTSPAQRRITANTLMLSALAGCAATFIAFIPQFLAWKSLFGSYLVFSYAKVNRIYPWPRHALDVLLTGWNSLFEWTPLAVFAVAGMVRAASRRNPLAWAGIYLFTVTTLIYGSWNVYWLGHSYGARGFADMSLYFFLGIAEFLHWFSSPALPRAARILAKGAVVLLVWWNFCQAVAYEAGIQRPDSHPDLSWTTSKRRAWRKQRRRETSLIRRWGEKRFPTFLPLAADNPTTSTGSAP